jgi:hypothetical protein
MKQIPEIEAYRLWKLCFSARIVSFQEFKESLLNNGYCIVSLETEGVTRPNKNAKVPQYDYITEGFDPDKLPIKNEKSLQSPAV